MAVTRDCWVNWQGVELLILDDWGLEAVNAEQRTTPCWRSWMIGMENTRR